MKRVWTLALALLLCLGLGAPALAAEEDFVMEEGVLVEYHGPGGEIAIPDGVYGIRPCAFGYREDITAVTFPDSLRWIESFAFLDCTGLTEVNLQEGVVLNDGAFRGCTGLTELTIPAGTIVCGGAFGDCTGLQRVEFLPAHIGEDPYSITISDVYDYAFSGCTSLTEVVLSGTGSILTQGQDAFAGTPWQKEQDRKERQPLIVGAVVGVALGSVAAWVIIKKKNAKH